MSPPVSPCQWRDRGSGSTEPKGLTHSRKAAFLRGWKSGNVDSFRTPPPAAPPLSALSRGRGGHCHAAQPQNNCVHKTSHASEEQFQTSLIVLRSFSLSICTSEEQFQTSLIVLRSACTIFASGISLMEFFNKPMK